jgi:hypothetical protein
VSSLNHDGSPVQLAWSNNSRETRLRILVDPGAVCAVPERRLRTERALEIVARRAADTRVDALLRKTLIALCDPADRDSEFPDGFAWVGAALDGPGFCAYVDARAGGDQNAAWRNIGRWLQATLASDAAARPILERLASEVEIQSAGIEGIGADDAVAKIYWRLPALVPIERFGEAGFATPEIVRFLDIALEQNAMRLSGLVLGLGFAVRTGEIVGVKLDLCGCPRCLNLGNAAWRQRVDAACDAFGLARFPPCALDVSGEVAFVGIGRASGGAVRLNLYTKPAA